jgi:nitrite reductase/ring-hydroxylating ferredoxin subunit
MGIEIAVTGWVCPVVPEPFKLISRAGKCAPSFKHLPPGSASPGFIGATLVRRSPSKLGGHRRDRRQPCTMPLRVVPPAKPPLASADHADPACRGCSRRAVLHGLAIAAAAAVVGCDGDPAAGPDGGSSGAVTMCGDKLCLDLSDPQNAALTSVDGSAIVAAPHDRILIVRTSATAFQAVTDTCTHAGCAVGYVPSRKRIRCPCHGSEYQVDGTVLLGPASRPLKQYATAHDADTNVLTIVL